MDANVTSLAPFGVEIDLDLSRPLDHRQQESLRALLYREKLLVFRNQGLSAGDQIRALGYFGRVLPPEEEHRELALDGDFGRSRLAYHADLMSTPEPYKLLSLYAIEVDEDGTTTRFIDGARGARALPPALRVRVEALEAVSVMPQVQSHRDIDYDPPAYMPRHCQPVIIDHPVTGEPILYVTELQTARIEGLPQAESDALLAELFTCLYADEAVAEHRWRSGDLVVWDNISLQHARDDQSETGVRRLRRVIVADKGFYELCPEFVMGDPKIGAWGHGEKYTAEGV
jgi:taurine dioxygenase